MNQAIADIIRGHIEDLDFVDKIAGLVSALTFEVKDKDNNMVQKTVPVACCVSADDCKEGAYNELMPDSAYKTVIYFEDGGVTFNKYESNWKYYTSNLRLVCWINIEKITESDCKSEIPCTYAAHIVADIIRALPEFPENHSPFDHVYSEVVSQEVRNPSIFGAYTYDEKHSQYLMAPYDYFALNIVTNFAICLKGTAVYDATCSTVTDPDGNEYGIATIGDQVWMTENYRLGGLSYDDDSSYDAVYGRLYTWEKANDIVLPGWHLPTLAEWTDLITELGGTGLAGGKLKETGTTHWLTPNTGSDNSSGFTAVGAGSKTNIYGFLREYSFFWTSSEVDATQSSYSYLAYNNDNCTTLNNGNKAHSFSVRLIKD